MSATAALEKWLELKRKSALPIFSAQPILGELQAQSSDLSLISEKILNVVIFSLVYILILILAGFINWFSRYLYFKAKRPNCTLVHSLYYTMLYPSGIGNFIINMRINFFTYLQHHYIQYCIVYVYTVSVHVLVLYCIVFYLYLNCTCTILVLVLYLYYFYNCTRIYFCHTCTCTVLSLYYNCTCTVLVFVLYCFV